MEEVEIASLDLTLYISFFLTHPHLTALNQLCGSTALLVSPVIIVSLIRAKVRDIPYARARLNPLIIIIHKSYLSVKRNCD